MDFGITDSIEGDVLTLVFTGQSTSANARAMTRRYFDILLKSGMKKVLADLRSLRGRLPPGETFFLVRDLPVRPVPTGIRTAVLEAKENLAYGKFMEDTAANAGVKLTCFIDKAEALAWLGAA